MKIEKLEKELRMMASKAAHSDSDTARICDLHKDHAEEISDLQESLKKDFEAEKLRIKKDLQQEFKKENSKTSEKLENCFKNKQEEYEKEISDLKTEIEKLQNETGTETIVAEEDEPITCSPADQVRELNHTITDLNSTVEELHARIQELEVQNVEDLRAELEQKEKDREEMAALLAETKAETEKVLEEQDVKIKNLMDQIKESGKTKGLSQQDQKTQRDEIERELRSKFAEAAAENHVHEVEAFEKQLQVIKEQADEREKELESELKSLKKEASKKDARIETLEAHVSELIAQVEELNNNLESKAEEIKHFSKKTDEYIRKREQQQIQAHNRKIVNIKCEHETELQKLKEREQDLLKELEELNQNSKQKEADDVSAEISELQEQVAQKEEVIEKLQSELLRQGSTGSSESNKDSPSSSTHSDSRKPSTSSSSGGPTDKPMCKKAANMALATNISGHSGSATTRKTCTKESHFHEKSPTPVTSECSEHCERQGRALSRTAPTSSSSSLKPPESVRSGKSPTRPGFLTKPKSVPIDKRPAWRF